MFNIAKRTDLEALKKQVEELTKLVEELRGNPKPARKRHESRPEGYYGKPLYKTLKEALETLKVPYDEKVTEYTFERKGWLVTIRPAGQKGFEKNGSYVITIGADLLVEKNRRYTQTVINITKQRTVANRVEAISDKEYVGRFQRETLNWVNQNFAY